MQSNLENESKLLQAFQAVPCFFMGRVEHSNGMVDVVSGISEGDLSAAVESVRKSAPGFFLREVFPVADPKAVLASTYGQMSSLGFNPIKMPRQPSTNR